MLQVLGNAHTAPPSPGSWLPHLTGASAPGEGRRGGAGGEGRSRSPLSGGTSDPSLAAPQSLAKRVQNHHNQQKKSARQQPQQQQKNPQTYLHRFGPNAPGGKILHRPAARNERTNKQPQRAAAHPAPFPSRPRPLPARPAEQRPAPGLLPPRSPARPAGHRAGAGAGAARAPDGSPGAAS